MSIAFTPCKQKSLVLSKPYRLGKQVDNYDHQPKGSPYWKGNYAKEETYNFHFCVPPYIVFRLYLTKI